MTAHGSLFASVFSGAHTTMMIGAGLFILFFTAVVLIGMRSTWQGMSQREKTQKNNIIFSAKEMEGLPLDATVQITARATGSASEPTTSTACVLWHLVEKRGSGEDAVTLRDEYSQEPITLTDHSGSIQLFPKGLEFPDADFKGQVVSQWEPNIQNRSRIYSSIIPSGTEVTVVAQVGQDERGKRFLHRADKEPASLSINQRSALWASRGKMALLGFMLVFILIFAGIFFFVSQASDPGSESEMYPNMPSLDSSPGTDSNNPQSSDGLDSFSAP